MLNPLLFFVQDAGILEGQGWVDGWHAFLFRSPRSSFPHSPKRGPAPKSLSALGPTQPLPVQVTSLEHAKAAFDANI